MSYVTLLSGYAGLASAIAANGVVTELSGSGYARQACALYYDTATGSVTVQGVEFGPGSGAWTTTTNFVLFDASSGGNAVLNYPLVFTGASGTSLNVPGGTIARSTPFASVTPGGTVLGTLAGVSVTLGPAAMSLSSGNVWSAAPPLTVLTYAASVTPNAATGGPRWTITLTGNLTLVAPSSPVPGAEYIIELVQDGTGSHTITLSGIKCAGGAPTLSTAANAIDVLRIIYDGTSFLSVLSKAYA